MTVHSEIWEGEGGEGRMGEVGLVDESLHCGAVDSIRTVLAVL